MRKNGQLEEAVAMAERDLQQHRDEWSCRALFWCLNDMAKQQEGEELSNTVERMCDLMETVGADDNVAKDCLKRLQRRLIPHAAEIRKAAEEAKNPANAPQIYNRFLEIFNAEELDESLHTDFAWIIYRTLHADESENVEYRKGLIEVYKQLNVEKPSVLHSLILGEAVRVEKEWPQMFMFTEFIAWWNLENLTDDDWEQFVKDNGDKIMSRVEKMIYLYTKEIQSIETLLPSDEFMAVLDKAIKKWSKDDNLIRCKAIMVTKNGDRDLAISLYKKTIELTTGQKYYLWRDLASLVDDANLKRGLFSKALSLRTPENYVGKLRLQLAALLCEMGLYANALYELRKVETTYNDNGWSIPPQVRTLLQAIPSGTEEANNVSQYSVWSVAADEYLYADIPSVYMVKVSERVDIKTKDDGSSRKVVKWTLIDQQGEVVGVVPNKYNLRKCDIGTCFEVKKKDGRIVGVGSVLNKISLTWLKDVEGEISIKNNKEGKPIGFVDNCYVPNNLLGQIQHGENVKGVAICQDNKWRCICVRRA